MSDFSCLWCVFLTNRQRPFPTWLAVSPAEYQSGRLPGAARLARISTRPLRAQRGGEGFCACRGNSYSQRQGFGAQACGNCSSTPPEGAPTCRTRQKKKKKKKKAIFSNQNRLLPQPCFISLLAHQHNSTLIMHCHSSWLSASQLAHYKLVTKDISSTL